MNKPLAILGEMVREYDVSVQQAATVAAECGCKPDFVPAGLDESFFDFPLPTQQSIPASMPDMVGLPSMVNDDGFMLKQAEDSDRTFATGTNYYSLGGSTPGPMPYLDEQEQHVGHDTLYGLFTSPLPFG